MSDETPELERLRAENAALRAVAATCAEHAYLPCDQTVQCACCGVVYWEQPEDIDENWHADGCALFAAEVLLGRSRDVRRGPAPKGCVPWKDPANEETANAIRAQLAALEMARFDAAHKAEEWEESAAIERKRADDAEARLDALVGAAQRERKALRARHVAMSAHTAAISREQRDADEVLRTGRAESEAIQRAREATAAMDAAMVAVGCP